MRVSFIHKWLDLQFKVDFNILRIFSCQFYFLSEFLPEICWKEIAEEILFVFHFWCLAWGSNRDFTSNKPTHYLLDHGDFTFNSIFLNTHCWSLIRYSPIHICTVNNTVKWCSKFSHSIYLPMIVFSLPSTTVHAYIHTYTHKYLMKSLNLHMKKTNVNRILFDFTYHSPFGE